MDDLANRLIALEDTVRRLGERMNEVEKGSFTKVSTAKVILREPGGKVRGGFGLTEDGIAMLTLLDADGAPRLVLGLQDEPGLHLYSSEGEALAAMKLDGAEPEIVLYQSSGKVGISLSVHKDTPHLLLFDEEERLRGGLSVESNVVNLTLHDVDERARLVAAARPDRALVAVLDSQGQTTSILD